MKKILSIIIIFFSFILITVPIYAKEGNEKFKTSLENLPNTKDFLNLEKDDQSKLDIGTVSFEKNEDENKYNISINYKNKKYRVVNKIPAQEETPRTFTGFYFTRKINGINEKFLYYSFEKINENNFKSSYFQDVLKTNLKLDILNPFVNKVIWNLNSGDYVYTDKFEIYATTNNPRNNDWYYLDFVLNQNVDKIIAVDINFEYERKYWFGQTYGPYNDALTILYTDKFKDGKNYKPYFLNEEQAIKYSEKLMENYKLNLYQYYNIRSSLLSNLILTLGENKETVLEARLKPAISYINTNGERVGMVGNNAEATSPQQASLFTSTFNDNLRKTLETYKRDNIGIDPNSVLGRYAEKRSRGLVGFTNEEIFNNSGNKIFSIPLLKHNGNLGYKWTNFKKLNFVNLAVEKNGQVFVINKNDIELHYAPSEQRSTFENVIKAIKSFFVRLWNNYKTFVIIILCLIGLIIISLLLLIIFNPKLINKILKILL